MKRNLGWSWGCTWAGGRSRLIVTVVTGVMSGRGGISEEHSPIFWQAAATVISSSRVATRNGTPNAAIASHTGWLSWGSFAQMSFSKIDVISSYIFVSRVVTSEWSWCLTSEAFSARSPWTSLMARKHKSQAVADAVSVEDFTGELGWMRTAQVLSIKRDSMSTTRCVRKWSPMRGVYLWTCELRKFCPGPCASASRHRDRSCVVQSCSLHPSCLIFFNIEDSFTLKFVANETPTSARMGFSSELWVGFAYSS